MQSTETIFVVIIIIVIVLLGFVFYSRVQESSIKEKQREQRVLRMITLAHALSNWPELECSTLESRDFDCIDRLKLGVLSDFINVSRQDDTYAFKYYNDLLRRSRIVITEVYSHTDKESWVVYDNSVESASKETVFIPVNVFDPTDHTFTFAMMELSLYE